ncbi:MAG: hypothetical protein V3T86_16490 [Planctomycetota bacterium]
MMQAQTDRVDRRLPHRLDRTFQHHVATELEDALGLEPALIERLCRSRLLGEVHLAQRPPAELENDNEFRTAVERQCIRDWFARPHVRVRPDFVRLTEDELMRRSPRRTIATSKKKKRK